MKNCAVHDTSLDEKTPQSACTILLQSAAWFASVAPGPAQKTAYLRWFAAVILWFDIDYFSECAIRVQRGKVIGSKLILGVKFYKLNYREQRLDNDVRVITH
jgi:hypothetical protein